MTVVGRVVMTVGCLLLAWLPERLGPVGFIALLVVVTQGYALVRRPTTRR